jgi:hypothetical protein
MTGQTSHPELLTAVRLHVFGEAAATGRVPQARQIAQALDRSEEEVQGALADLGRAKVLIMAPNDGSIWSANPFCAVPSGFRVDARSRTYWGICIWDALGIAAALNSDAVISAPCGDCGAALKFEVRDGELLHGDGVVHFAVPAHHWWDNIGFT